ncbi:MAG: hypothetical protein AB1Z98_28675 [Nannocystaceae bacterium]
MRHIESILTISAAATTLLLSACDPSTDSLDGDLAELEVEDAIAQEAAAAPLVDEQTPLKDGEERFGEGVTPLDRVTLSGGLELTFVHMDIGGEESLGVIEHQPLGALGLADLGIDDASSPLDLYLALTGPTTEVPEALRRLAVDNQLGERGWLDQQVARGDFDLAAEPNIVTAACDGGFQSYLTNWRTDIDEYVRWALGEDIDNDTSWYGPSDPLGLGIGCTDCTETWWHRDYYNDQFEIYNVDEMKMAVSACAIGWRPDITTNYGHVLEHYGPTLRFRYRTENNAATVQAYSNDLAESEEGGRWRWYWYGSSASGDNDFDWTIEIANARATDLFDLGWFWNHNGW